MLPQWLAVQDKAEIQNVVLNIRMVRRTVVETKSPSSVSADVSVYA